MNRRSFLGYSLISLFLPLAVCESMNRIPPKNDKKIIELFYDDSSILLNDRFDCNPKVVFVKKINGEYWGREFKCGIPIDDVISYGKNSNGEKFALVFDRGGLDFWFNYNVSI